MDIVIRVQVDVSPALLAALQALVRAPIKGRESADETRAPAKDAVAPKSVDGAPDDVRGRVAARASSHIVWTPERLAVLERDYPANVALAELFEALNKIEGPAVKYDQIAVAAAHRGLRRQKPPMVTAPDPPIAEAIASPPEPRLEMPTPAPAAIETGKPWPADRATIAHWAGARGLAPDGFFDLKRVNAKRIDLGLPPYVLMMGETARSVRAE